jgi:hypothetical protein
LRPRRQVIKFISFTSLFNPHLGTSP